MPGELRYMVAVMKDGRHLCGGAIIGKRHILTAGHCVENPRNLSVVSDIVDLNDSERNVHEVSKVIVHPDYVPYTKNTNIERDIAIIMVKTLRTRISGFSPAISTRKTDKNTVERTEHYSSFYSRKLLF